MPRAWIAVYHSDIFDDLESMGKLNAAKALKIIESLLLPDPSHLGAPTESGIPGGRLFKSENFHVLYQLIANSERVHVLAIRQESGISGRADQKAKTHREVG